MSGRGLYFLDCTQGTTQKSALAVYDTFLENGGNNNQTPTLFIEITSAGQGFFVWETGTKQIFNYPNDEGDGIEFTISATAQSVTDGSQVGTAQFERNLVEHFEVFRDNGHVLFTTSDGFVCTSAYFSREVGNPAS